MGCVNEHNAGISLSGLLQHGLGQHLKRPVGGGGAGECVNTALPLAVQKLAGVISGVLVGIGAVRMQHRLHIGIVPAFDEAAGVLRVIFHGDNIPALHQDRNIFLPAEIELSRLSGVVAVL